MLDLKNIYCTTIDNIDELMVILKQYDISIVEHIFFLKGENIDEVLDTLGKADDLDLINYEIIRNLVIDIIRKSGFKSFGVQRRLNKLYNVRCDQQDKLKKRFHKGLELYTEGRIQYYNGSIEQGIKLVTMSFIDDYLHLKQKSFTSDAYRFLANHVYGEKNGRIVGDRIAELINLRDPDLILRPDDFLNSEDLIDIMPPKILRNLFNLNIKKYNHLIEEIKTIKKENRKKKDTQQKVKSNGIQLEELAKCLFCSIDGCHFVKRRKLTDSSELDLVYRVIDRKHPLFSMFGEYLIIECKDLEKKVSAATIRTFLANLLSINVNGGILITFNGISGSSLKNAKLEIKKAYHRHGIVILTFDHKDLESITKNRNLLSILYEKYEMVRFDDMA